MNSRLWFAGCVWLLTAITDSLIASQAPLSITNFGGSVAISWPLIGGNWALEGSPALPPGASWAGVVPFIDQTNGTVRRVVIVPGDTNRFFRLRRLGPNVPGLTGRWRLDEGAGQVANDNSGGDSTLFIAGANWASGRIGAGALQFNGNAGVSGSRSWVYNDDYQILPRTDRPFSVSFWFNPDVLTTGWRGLAGTDVDGSGGWHVALLTTGPGTNYVVFAGVGLGDSLNVSGRTLLLPGQWYRLVVTYDGFLGTIYLDGARLADGTGLVESHNGPVYFGGGIGGYSSFLGRIDDIRTFADCVGEEMIGLNAEFLFSEGFGQFAGDSSGGENHATLTDSSAWSTGTEGLGFDLRKGQLLIPNDDLAVLPPTGKPFGLSFWLRLDAAEPGRFGLMSCGSQALRGWQMDVAFAESGRPILHFGSVNFGGTLDLSAPIDLVPDAWSKIDLTFNGGIATVYCNGRKAGTAWGAIRASRDPLVISEVAGLARFPGVMDNLRIYGIDRPESAMGPMASVMWETALWNSSTNFPLRGSGPQGRSLVYAVDPTITPTNGTVSIAPGSSVAAYVAGSRKGPDAFTYTVSDGTFTSAPAIFHVSVVEPHWLSPAGGSESVLDGRSPTRAWRVGKAREVDAIWRTNNFYDCFFYAPGVYETRGYKYLERSTANPGCKHVGSGLTAGSKTTLKLVDIYGTWTEENFFSPLHGGQTADDFEVHNMVLDCNAQGVPKYVIGEPVWIHIPLTSRAQVNAVTLRWANSIILGSTIGRAAAFSVCSIDSAFGNSATNCGSYLNQGASDLIALHADSDGLLLELTSRANGVDFYGLTEVEISGATPSLPSATVVGGSQESRLGPGRSVLMALDEDQGTAWASGPEAQVRIVLPVAKGTTISQLNLHWNCRLEPGLGQLGPARAFQILARDETSGLYVEVPFVRQTRDASGLERAVFGTGQSPASVTTDSLLLLLTEREAGVDYYSLREVSLQNGSGPVNFRIPTSATRSHWGGYSILRAFDKDLSTEWASGTQGAVTAISLGGNNLKFRNLEIIGFGTKAGREGFPIFIGPPSSSGSAGQAPSYGNVLIESCSVRSPATNNTDGMTAITLAGNARTPLTNAIVRGCTVEGLRPYFSYSQAFSAAHVEWCRVVDCSRAVYFEPDPGLVDSVGPVTIQNNRFIDVDSAVYLASHPNAVFDSILCADNEIVLSGRNGWGFAICDDCYTAPARSTTNVVVLNNVIRYPNWAPRPSAFDGGLYYSDIRHAVFGNNVVALGNSYAARVRAYPSGLIPPPPEDCHQFPPDPPPPAVYAPNLDSLPPGYRRAWFGNRDISGALLPVHFQTNGVDRLASQQQWPD